MAIKDTSTSVRPAGSPIDDETPEETPAETSRHSLSVSLHSDHSDADARGLEAQERAGEKAAPTPAEAEDADPNLVTWDSPDSQENPRNWSKRHRWAVTTLVSSYTFLSPLASSMIAPALPLLSEEFNVHSSVRESMMLSTFVLAYSCGPLLLAPLTEMFGRRVVLQTTNLMFIAFNLGCGASQNAAQLTVLRFFAGLGGSAPLAVGGGTIADLFEPGERGSAMGMYSLAPLLGPAIGPIVGGWIVQELGQWRWIFWVSSIYGGLTAFIGLFLLPETYAPEILKRKARKLRKETGNEQLHTIYEKQDSSKWYLRLRHNLVRPFVLLTTQPIIQVFAVYMAILYGCMYILLTVFPQVFGTIYNEEPGIASLNYISLAIGFTIGGQVGGRVVDYSYRTLSAREADGKGRPEFKLPLLMVTSSLFPAGLLIYGWTAAYKVHWIAPNIGAALFAAGAMGTFLVCQGYLVDVLPLYAASVLAAAVLVRSLGGFGFPLFAPTMYERLGQGWGNTVLALVSAVIGIPAPWVLFRYGPYLRAKSRYAAENPAAARMK
ncbi:MFS multidrug transporter [Moesziomyces antarcticus]|uniref:Related to MFS multidrug transporter n=2 Tax=Pseudozyma antarctica TaxID=84753 RepID=A0A5C3FY37_PSEA2|nr:MFS multidrug transporter [Moesziomyces antarcticus]GAK67647.1 MFS multidrug transporter [Moesziomyces antarcticus]SPO49120.1 related to MFS multidrug transporter [Moesziomyces antarcticus]